MNPNDDILTTYFLAKKTKRSCSHGLLMGTGIIERNLRMVGLQSGRNCMKKVEAGRPAEFVKLPSENGFHP